MTRHRSGQADGRDHGRAVHSATVANLVRSRDRILEAALWALDASAESGFTIDQIAEAARVGKQSIYQHFGDRDGLIVAAQAERYRRSILTGQDILLEGLVDCVTQDDYARLLITMASVATRTGSERRRLRAQALGSAATRPALQKEIRDAHRASIAALAKIFAFGQKRDWVDTAYSASTLSGLWFAMLSGHHVSESYADDADRESINAAVVDAISLMLFGRTFPELNNPDTVAKALMSYGVPDNEKRTADGTA